jgi:hypothetical protein
MKEVVWCFLSVKGRTSTENYKAAYELWRKRNPNLRTNMDAKLLLNQKNYILGFLLVRYIVFLEYCW